MLIDVHCARDGYIYKYLKCLQFLAFNKVLCFAFSHFLPTFVIHLLKDVTVRFALFVWKLEAALF